MFSKTRRRLFHTTTVRVAFWYTALFSLSSFGLFGISYFYLHSTLNRFTDSELVETASELGRLYQESGMEALRSELQREAKSWGQERAFFLLRGVRGEIIVSSDLQPWGDDVPAFAPAMLPAAADGVQMATLRLPGRSADIRLVTAPIADGLFLQIGQDLQDNARIMREFRRAFLAALAIMLVCGSAVGFLVARRAMSGVRRMALVASHIGKDNLQKRVPLDARSQEIDDLTRAFNAMLERIELLVRELREVTDNVAHDLRSPITRIRGLAEAAATTPQGAESYRSAMGEIVAESDRLVGIIDTMLEITETEAGVVPMTGEQVDLSALLRDAHDLFTPMAEQKGVSLELRLPAHGVAVWGDRARLQRVVGNLLDNAIKYTPYGGHVATTIETAGTEVRIRVSDDGVGIEEDELHRVFERFYRGDKSRSTHGNGLGLSLARAIVQAHHGEITVNSTAGKGSDFTVTLPRTAAQ